jgi:hypothetical protein
MKSPLKYILKLVIPIVLQSCNTGAATYNFDLTKNTTIILTETIRHRVQLKIYTPPSTTNITYHLPILTRVKLQFQVSTLL